MLSTSFVTMPLRFFAVLVSACGTLGTICVMGEL